MWTAYYLKKAEPSLRVAIVEKEIAGYGASGRNGGWCSAIFAAGRDKIARRYGRDAAVAMQRAMFDTVDEVGRQLNEENIDAHFVKGGMLAFATTRAHVARLQDEVAEERAWGFGEDDYRWLDASEASARIDIDGNLGALYSPHCARVQPARLVRGLARVVEALGVPIFERTPALDVNHGEVTTSEGMLRSSMVVRAIEGYTPHLPGGHRRRLMPLYSLMIVTEPLPHSFWQRAGWSGYETFGDGRHLLIYAQRTMDDRIAIGGRGAPYHFASRVKDEFDREPRVFEELKRVLKALFPYIGEVAITDSWGGPLGVPRDWFSSVGIARAARVAWAGGYVGDGVSTTNLAGRTLTDLILERDTDLIRLPWVNHRSRFWEPEPLRWIGTNLALWTMGSADHAEARSGRPSRRADLVGKLIGL